MTDKDDESQKAGLIVSVDGNASQGPLFADLKFFWLLSIVLHAVVLAGAWFWGVTPTAGQSGEEGCIVVNLCDGLPGRSVEKSAAGRGGGTADFVADNSAQEATALRQEEPIPQISEKPREKNASVTAPAAPAQAVPVVAKPRPASQREQEPQKTVEKKNPSRSERLHAASSVSEPGERTQGSLGDAGHNDSGKARGQSGQAAENGNGGTPGGKGASSGDSNEYLTGNYEYIKKRVRQYLVYSPHAKRMGIQGTTTVAFTILRDGKVREITINQSSGHGTLDEAALEAVQNAAPFAPPPEPARVIMPVQFRLK